MTPLALDDWPEATLSAASRALQSNDRVTIAGAHLVGAYDAGPINLALLRRIVSVGWQVAVPTTLNSSSADLTQGPASVPFACPAYLREHDAAREVVQLLEALGCILTLSCAPYFGQRRPAFKEICVWAESNAVLFANSVLGARVLRAPQYLDLACALIGEAPLAATLTDEGRRPTVVFDCQALPPRWFTESAGFELLGLWLGQRLGDNVPLLTGLPRASETQLRSLCAAVGTASDCAMLHVAGQTPESREAQAHAEASGLYAAVKAVAPAELLVLRQRLAPPEGAAVRSIAVGAPHASVEQVQELRAVLRGCPARLPRILLSLGRETAAALPETLAELRSAGVDIVQDSCTYYGSFVGRDGGPVLTPSVKWALYGRANLNIDAWFGSAGECWRALETGRFIEDKGFWRV